MSASNVPALSITAAGVVLPDESDILSGVLADYNAAFGGNLNTTNLETPQGQLATSTAAVIADANAQFALIVNQVDPAVADGVFQDAIGRIYYIERTPAEATTVDVVCSGLAGVSIIAGAAQVKDANGNIYAASSNATIGTGGTVTVPFACLTTGPIACASGAISGAPYATGGVVGWDSATNPAAGVTGNDVESRYDFEYRRQQSVAANAHGSLPAIKAAVLTVSGVLDVYATENYTGSAVTVGSTSKSLAAHSLYVAVVGGTDADVAAAIWSKKDVGCDMVGNTTVTVTDSENYSAPYPTYSMKFQRPSALAVKFAVSLVNSSTLPSDIVTQVRNALVSAFAGGDGLPRARVGATIYASRFYSTIASLDSKPLIISVHVGTGSGTPTADSVLVGIDQVPTLSASDITVTLV